MDSLGMADTQLQYPFGLDADRIEAQLIEEKLISRSVCVCGHPGTAHYSDPNTGLNSCSVAKSYCPCSRVIPVLEVDDKRSFTFLTTGPEGLHALSKGIRKALKQGNKVVPIQQTACFPCRTISERLIPVAISREGFMANTPQATNGLLCPDCFEQLSNRANIADLMKPKSNQ